MVYGEKVIINYIGIELLGMYVFPMSIAIVEQSWRYHGSYELPITANWGILSFPFTTRRVVNWKH